MTNGNLAGRKSSVGGYPDFQYFVFIQSFYSSQRFKTRHRLRKVKER